MVERKLFLVVVDSVVDLDVDSVVELHSHCILFVLPVTDFQYSHHYFSLFQLYAQTLIEDRYTPLVQFLLQEVLLFEQTELVYCLGSGWVGLGVKVLN